jgi:pyrimidine operon attenuation protein / uracil phosphoribosyltransferase
MIKLPDVNTLIAKLAQEIGTPSPGTVIVGIHTGGVWVAERLAAALKMTEPLGTLAITLHRDDYGKIGLHRQARTTRMPVDIEGRHLLLVDDVIYTGRTIRAALNELFDFGRPASVKLVCLADRGGRQLPIAPDYTGAIIDVASGEELVLNKDGDRLTLQLHKK